MTDDKVVEKATNLKKQGSWLGRHVFISDRLGDNTVKISEFLTHHKNIAVALCGTVVLSGIAVHQLTGSQLFVVLLFFLSVMALAILTGYSKDRIMLQIERDRLELEKQKLGLHAQMRGPLIDNVTNTEGLRLQDCSASVPTTGDQP